jgi:hypothetical protein
MTPLNRDTSVERYTVVNSDPLWKPNRATNRTFFERGPNTVVAHRCGHPVRWVACRRLSVSTSIPQDGHWTYWWPVKSPYASRSTNGPFQSTAVLIGDSAAVIPVDSTPVGFDSDMLRLVGEARSGATTPGQLLWLNDRAVHYPIEYTEV